MFVCCEIPFSEKNYRAEMAEYHVILPPTIIIREWLIYPENNPDQMAIVIRYTGCWKWYILYIQDQRIQPMVFKALQWFNTVINGKSI